MTARIRIPTFDATIVYMWDVDKVNLKRYVNKKYKFDIENLHEQFAGITVSLDNLSWLIYVPDTGADDLIWLARTLSHEANHVILQLMKAVGVEDEETICYAQDNLLGELLRYSIKGMIKKKKNNKRKSKTVKEKKKNPRK